jgi:DNA polymerase-3 subunit epsilon
VQASYEAAPIEYVRRIPRPNPLPTFETSAEAEAHAAFIAKLGPNALWLKYGT